MTGWARRMPPGLGIGPFVGIGGALGLVVAAAISTDVALGIVFGACVGVVTGLMLDLMLAQAREDPGQAEADPARALHGRIGPVRWRSR